jgi:hypothetical protein
MSCDISDTGDTLRTSGTATRRRGSKSWDLWECLQDFGEIGVFIGVFIGCFIGWKIRDPIDPIDPDPILDDHWILKKQVKSVDSEARPADATIFGEKGHTFLVRMSGEILYRKRHLQPFNII